MKTSFQTGDAHLDQCKLAHMPKHKQTRSFCGGFGVFFQPVNNSTKAVIFDTSSVLGADRRSAYGPTVARKIGY